MVLTCSCRFSSLQSLLEACSRPQLVCVLYGNIILTVRVAPLHLMCHFKKIKLFRKDEDHGKQAHRHPVHPPPPC